MFIRALEIETDTVIDANQTELFALKQLRKNQVRLVDTPTEKLNKMYFEDLFAIYEAKKNLTHEELHEFVQKSMVKKLKKATNECGQLNASFQNFVKRSEQMTMKMANHEITKNKIEAEFSMRPELSCDFVKQKTQEISKDIAELTKKKSDFEHELAKSRLEKIIDTFYKQAQDNKKQNETRTFIIENQNDTQKLAELLSNETSQNVTESIAREVITAEVVEQLINATVDNLEAKIEAIHDHCKDIIEDLKKKEEDAKKAAEEALKAEEPKPEEVKKDEL